MQSLSDVEEPRRQAARLAGQTLSDRYRVEHLIHSSAMSHVYEGHDTVLDRRVAIKVMRDEDQADSRPICRFFLEARLGKRLATSPYCVRVTDVGFTDLAVPYFVMDYLVGEDLAAYLRRRKTVPFEHAIEIVLELCSAVADLHAAGVVHRDIKPSNVFVLKDGSVRLIDFGVCKSSLDDLSLTTTGTLVGSLPYVPPERWIDPDDARLSGDVWALAVVLYELLTGRLPFRATARDSLQQAILNDDVDVGFAGAEQCAELQTVLGVALHKDPGYRYGTVTEFAAALSRAAFDAGLRDDPAWNRQPERATSTEHQPLASAPESLTSSSLAPSQRAPKQPRAGRWRGTWLAAALVSALGATTAGALLDRQEHAVPSAPRVTPGSLPPSELPAAVAPPTTTTPLEPPPAVTTKTAKPSPLGKPTRPTVATANASELPHRAAAPLPRPRDPQFPDAPPVATPSPPPPRSPEQQQLDVTPSDLTHF